MNFLSILGLVINALALLSPSLFGIKVPDEVTGAFLATGTAIFGLFTKQQNGVDLFSTVVGFVPALLWVLINMVGVNMPPQLQYDVTYVAIVIIGIVSKSPNMEEVLKKLRRPGA